jgi:HK97 family phage major capsid protein
VRSDQRFGDHELVREYASRESERDKHITGTYANFAQQIRSLSTSGASAVVPTEWSFPIIDKARNAAVAFKAGCTLVPMPAKVVQIGRLTTDPTATFRTEGSTVTASDPAFDFVQLQATTLSALTVASMEFLQDAPDADQVVSEAIAKAMALELDKAILFGQLGATGTNDEGAAYALASPYPKGVLKNLLDNASAQVLGFGTNGTAQTAATPWNEVVGAYYQVKTQNEMPGAIVSSDKLVQQYNSLYTSFNNVIDKPPVLRDVPWLTTNVIPSYTRGTMTSRATDLFVGDWSQVLVGQRLDFTVRVLTERYAELGQVGILSHWRGDVQVARPKALAVYRALQGA